MRSRVPVTVAELEKLPGVGPYAANAFASFHADQRGVLLDSNIVRFYGRLLGLKTGPETRRSRLFREIAEVVTPDHRTKRYNYSVLDFTRRVCTTRPLCSECPLQACCAYRIEAIQRQGSAGLVLAAP